MEGAYLHSNHRQNLHRDAIEFIETAPGSGLSKPFVDIATGLGIKAKERGFRDTEPSQEDCSLGICYKTQMLGAARLLCLVLLPREMARSVAATPSSPGMAPAAAAWTYIPRWQLSQGRGDQGPSLASGIGAGRCSWRQGACCRGASRKVSPRPGGRLSPGATASSPWPYLVVHLLGAVEDVDHHAHRPAQVLGGLRFPGARGAGRGPPHEEVQGLRQGDVAPGVRPGGLSAAGARCGAGPTGARGAEPYRSVSGVMTSRGVFPRYS